MAKKYDNPRSDTVAQIIIDGFELSSHLQYMEWVTYINSGFKVRGEILDANLIKFKQLAGPGEEEPVTKFLKKARKKPIEIKFLFGYDAANKDKNTGMQEGYITNMRGVGTGPNAKIEFVGIDKPSFLLNAGIASAKIYEGNVEKVIKDVVKEYTNDEIKVNISKTDDNEKNQFGMVRMDPKTFIGSILDWSSALSKNKSRWIVSSSGDTINIKKETELKGVHMGDYDVAYETNFIDGSWYVDLNSFISVYQTRVATGGISAVSGKFIYEVLDDEKTAYQKLNSSNLKSDRSTSKPKGSDSWPVDMPVTFIGTVPEHSGGEIGKEYSEYIDGRARQKYLSMMGMVMRMKVTVVGNSQAKSSELLGSSTVTINCKTADKEDYFISGNWLVYGFGHYYFKDVSQPWTTDLYLYRLDHDALAKEAKN